MAMLAILAACHGYFACGNKVLFCSVLSLLRTKFGERAFSHADGRRDFSIGVDRWHLSLHRAKLGSFCVGLP